MSRRGIRKKYQGPSEVKFAILVILFNESNGLNAYKIQHSPLIRTSQEWTRFKVLLEELCETERIEKIRADFVREGAEIYKITQKGKDTVQKVKESGLDPLLRGFIVTLDIETDTEP